jgi:diphosphomevalonate decarboxylase
MQLSVETSDLLHYRAKELVPKILKKMSTAILDRDYKQFAELTMKVSDT